MASSPGARRPAPRAGGRPESPQPRAWHGHQVRRKGGLPSLPGLGRATVSYRVPGHCLETFLVVSAGERALSPGG